MSRCRFFGVFAGMLLLTGYGRLHAQALDPPAGSKEPRKVEVPDFVDIGIAGILFVRPETTLLVAGKNASSLLDTKSAFPSIALRLCNRDGTENVLLINQPGDPPLGFSLAVVNTGCPEATPAPLKLAKAKYLATYRGIRLGMSRLELVERLGPQFTERKVKDYVAIRCSAKDVREHEFLKGFGRLGYVSEYRLRDDKLFSFRFGFEN